MSIQTRGTFDALSDGVGARTGSRTKRIANARKLDRLIFHVKPPKPRKPTRRR